MWRRCPYDALTRAVGPALAARLHRLANGIDPRDVQTTAPRRASGTRTPSATTWSTRSRSRANCCGSRPTSPSACARPASSRAPSRSSCATATSAPSRGRARWPSPRMSRAASTTRRTPLGELVGDGRAGAAHRRARRAPPRRRAAAPLWDPDEDWRDAERTIDEVDGEVRPRRGAPGALVRPGAPSAAADGGHRLGARRSRRRRRAAAEPSGRMASPPGAPARDAAAAWHPSRSFDAPPRG